MPDDDSSPNIAPASYVLPEQHPRTDVPKSEVHHVQFTDEEWDRINNSLLNSRELLSKCEQLFSVDRNPGSDPVYAHLRPQLEDMLFYLENDMRTLERTIGKVKRYLGMQN